MYSFRGYMEQLIFDSSYLLRAATFLEEHFYSVHFLRTVSWFNHPKYFHPSFEVRHLFLPQKEWQAFILWKILYLFWREILQSSIDWVIFPAVVFLFPKTVGFNYAFFQSYYNCFYRTLAAIHSCSGTVHFSDVKVCNYHLLPMHFLSVCFRILVTVKKNNLLKQLYFQSSII